MVTENSEQLSVESTEQLQTEEQEQLQVTGETSEAEGGEATAETGEAEEKTGLEKLHDLIEAEKSKVQSAVQKAENEKLVAAEQRTKEAEDQAALHQQQTQQSQLNQAIAQMQSRHKADIEEFGESERIKQLHQSEWNNQQWGNWYQQNIPMTDQAMKVWAAHETSKLTGISIDDLLKANTPEEMKQMGKYLKETTRIGELEKQLKDLQEQAKAAQDFDQSVASTTSIKSDEAFIDAIANGKIKITPEIEARYKKITGL